MRILITNSALTGRNGTSLYVRDLAFQLLRRGHTPIVYSTELGKVAWELRGATIPVTDDLDALDAAPDLIHGHHNHELFTALLRFPGVPAVRVCHGWVDERPWPFPRIRRYVAVDDTTRDRCLHEWGLPEDQVMVLLNWVDLEQFPRRSPLPPRPRKALVFSNNASRYLWAIRQACSANDIEVDAVGESLGAITEDPGRLLPQYDLVFAKARAAMEAMAAGCSVILCDAVGCGPMVTSGEVAQLRRLNFGMRTLRNPIEPALINRQIARYDAEDASLVSSQIRQSAGIDAAVDQWQSLYEEILADEPARPAADPAEEMRATSRYLRSLPSRLKEWPDSGMLGLRIMLRSMYRKMRRSPFLRTFNSSTTSQWADSISRKLRG
ncbi:MAG: glycosyltransferase family 4 protein [Gemmatimonadota bacterium]